MIRHLWYLDRYFWTSQLSIRNRRNVVLYCTINHWKVRISSKCSKNNHISCSVLNHWSFCRRHIGRPERREKSREYRRTLKWVRSINSEKHVNCALSSLLKISCSISIEDALLREREFCQNLLPDFYIVD